MAMPKQRLLRSVKICAGAAVLLVVLGCATPSPPPVVVPPVLNPGPLPPLVEKTLPLPAGSFLRSLRDFSSSASSSPTPSTPPTPAAAKTP